MLLTLGLLFALLHRSVVGSVVVLLVQLLLGLLAERWHSKQFVVRVQRTLSGVHSAGANHLCRHRSIVACVVRLLVLLSLGLPAVG